MEGDGGRRLSEDRREEGRRERKEEKERRTQRGQRRRCRRKEQRQRCVLSHVSGTNVKINKIKNYFF